MKSELANIIDHTCLKPDATSERIRSLCKEASENHFFAVCVPPVFVRSAGEFLAETSVQTCTVIGFPLGFNSTAVKCFEAETVLADGAGEIDMVINIGALKEGRFDYVEKEITMVAALLPEEVKLKVIIETALLSEEQKRNAVQIIMDTPAQFIKTSTGFAAGGATVEDVRFIKEIVGNNKKIKAAGGIRTRDLALRLVRAGASRLGCSNSLEIIKGE